MASLLSSKQRLRIATRHREAIGRHGYRVGALFWSSEAVQQIRFEQLAGLIDQHGQADCSVLDVGCGFGDLKHFLAEKGFAVDYHGIDLSPDMVQSAAYQTPGIRVDVGDIFDLGPADNRYDFVLLSGALNEVVDEPPAEPGDYARAVIRRMYRAARHGVAFNLLDARHAWTAARPDLQSFLPQAVLDHCRSFADEVRLVDGYLENDFTIYLLKRHDRVGPAS